MVARRMTYRVRGRRWAVGLWALGAGGKSRFVRASLVHGRVACVVVCVSSVVLIAQVRPAVAEALKPTIDATAAREVTPTSAVVEAQINPSGNAGLYQINLMVQSLCSADEGERVNGAETSALGRLEAASNDVTVSHTFTGLTSGYVYWYSVYAASRAGGETGTEVPRSFGLGCVDDFPEGSLPRNMPYLGARVTLLSVFLLEEEATLRARATEEERQRAAAREREEREAREAGWRAEEEAAIRRAAAAGDTPNPAVHSHCLVPSVMGDELRLARRLITRAHCALGQISRRHASRHRRLVVVAQSPRHGRTASPGTAVTITLGSAPARR